jgi:PLP dependent protein
VGPDTIRVLFDLGVRDVGENRVEPAKAKRAQLSQLPLRWHMVGNLQRRKIAPALEVFDAIDAVDRMTLAQALERRAAQANRQTPVLLEVNVAGEAAKHGFAPESLEAAYQDIRQLPHLRVDGLMTMAPFVDDPEQVRPVFRRLRELAGQLGLPELSMGMSNDFEIAVEEGATQVRIGTALFT